MKPLSQVAQSLPRSGIREVMAVASEMEGVIHLEVGEPSFGTPPHIIETAFERASAGATRYTSNYGIPPLRKAIAERYSARWDRPVEPAEVMATHGGVNAISAMLFAMLEPGDEVLVPDPAWPNYIGMIGLARGIPVRYPLALDGDFEPDATAVASLVTPRTKALILCNPGNPTGAVWRPETVEAMVALAEQHDLYVISDEIYEELVFDGEHTPAARFDNDGRVVTVSGFSKTYAMTGWRLGWAVARPELVTLAGKMQEPVLSCPSSISQEAGVAALTGPQEAVGIMRESYRARRDIARSILEPAGLLPVVPRGAFYAMVDLRRTGLTSRELAFGLLEEEKVATAPGSTFGTVAEGFVRVSLASSDEDVTEGCRRIVAYGERHAAEAPTNLARVAPH